MSYNSSDKHQEMGDKDDNSPAVEKEIENTTSPAVASAGTFKADVERFKHVDTPDTTATGTTQATAVRQSGRKRQLELQFKPLEPTPHTAKKKRPSSRYAPPSKYAHLAELTDILEPNLICVFVGFNPGVRTATVGHAYAHPSNTFWKLLHSSGCTDVRLRPEQDVDLPRLYGMGNTNIVARPSRDAAELSKAESAAGTPILEEKLRTFRPEVVCIVGKGIWESIWRWRYERAIKKHEFHYGWQHDRERMGKTDDWEGAAVFVATATSGLSASLQLHEKEAIWKPFGEWVKKRREERVQSSEESTEVKPSDGSGSSSKEGGTID